MSVKNTIRTIILFLAVFLLFQLIGTLFAYVFNSDLVTTMVAFIIFAAIFNFGAYFLSDKLVLAAYRARIVSKEER